MWIHLLLNTGLAIVAEQMLLRFKKNYFLDKYGIVSSNFYVLPQ